MIQRIQSLYLFLASAAMALMMFIPSMIYISSESEYILKAYGYLLNNADGAPATIVAETVMMRVTVFLAIILPLLLIFVYKNRETQLRLCYVQTALTVAAQAAVIYYGYFAYGDSITGQVVPAFGMGLIMPAVSFVFTLLATIGIRKDIKLVKSLDRIR